jgi:hypothetical protein
MTPRHVEIRMGGQVVAAAEVTLPVAGTARTSLRAAAGHVAPGRRSDLVDAVMDLPEVQASHRLEATVPLGDDPHRDYGAPIVAPCVTSSESGGTRSTPSGSDR